MPSFFIPNWQAGIKSSLYHSAVCYYHLGPGVKPQDDKGDETGDFIHFIYLHFFTNDLY